MGLPVFLQGKVAASDNGIPQLERFFCGFIGGLTERFLPLQYDGPHLKSQGQWFVPAFSHNRGYSSKLRKSLARELRRDEGQHKCVVDPEGRKKIHEPARPFLGAFEEMWTRHFVLCRKMGQAV